MDITNKINKLFFEKDFGRLSKKDIIRKLNEPASIQVLKRGTNMRTKAQGNSFNVLILLAKLEKDILRGTKCPKEDFEAIKEVYEEMLEDEQKEG